MWPCQREGTVTLGPGLGVRPGAPRAPGARCPGQACGCRAPTLSGPCSEERPLVWGWGAGNARGRPQGASATAPRPTRGRMPRSRALRPRAPAGTLSDASCVHVPTSERCPHPFRHRAAVRPSGPCRDRVALRLACGVGGSGRPSGPVDGVWARPPTLCSGHQVPCSPRAAPRGRWVGLCLAAWPLSCPEDPPGPSCLRPRPGVGARGGGPGRGGALSPRLLPTA